MKDNTNNSSSVSDDSHNAEDHGSDDEEAEPLVLEVDGSTTTSSTRGYALKRRPLVQFLGIYVLILLPMAGIGLSTVLLVGHATTSQKKNSSTTTSASASATEPPATMNDNKKPVTLSTGVAHWDAAFLVAMAEVSENIMANGNFMAGAGWTQLWTRDTSYAVQLGLALLYPQVSQVTLEACTQPHDDKDGHQHTLDSNILGTTTWLQDVCGHFNGWPYLSDAIVGAQGAWSLFLATGNTTFLEWAYNMTRSTLTWAELEVYDNTTGLFRGCSSFMESNSAYPTEYRFSGPKVGATKALSTNVLYYNGYTLAAQMEQVLHPGKKDKTNSQQLQTKAKHLRKAIRSRLWLEDHGYYAYYEEANGTLHPKMEGLGESLLLLAPNLESNQTRIRRLFESVHRTPHGIPCLWPQFDLHREKPKDYASYYHNGRIWPFVQGYWALAAARHKQVDVFQQELDSLVGLAMNSAPMETDTTGTQDQPTFAEFYQLDGTYMWKRRRQLWSSAGYLGMILHGLFGMELQVDGILFRPVVPAQSTNTTSTTEEQVMTLENLRYRRALLTLHITGHGTVVDTFAINGKPQDKPFLAADAVGHQKIEMVLKQDG